MGLLWHCHFDCISGGTVFIDKSKRILRGLLHVAMLQEMRHACADGLGIAVDAPYSKELQRLLSEAFAAKKVVAAVGRGVAALLSAKITDPTHPQAGMPIVYGKQVPGQASSASCPPHE